MSKATGSERDATVLARKLVALPEREMREAVLLDYLEGADTQRVIAALDTIHTRGCLGGPPFDAALLALAGVLNRRALPYDLMANLYQAAKDQGLDKLGQLFFSTLDSEPHRDRPSDVERELTLGHRKVMARGGNRDEIARLLKQPEFEVIPHLLKNPRLTERDVVLLAARRPTDPLIQRALVENNRWIGRYSVKRAIVLNPYTPADISTRMLPFMVRSDLRLVQDMSSLPEPVRQAAHRLEESRATKGSAPDV